MADPKNTPDPSNGLETAVMGDKSHRAWVGPPDYYDRLGALQFVALLLLGMREHHSLLDLGCGSLRGGRFSIMYLKPDKYCGVDPEAWCVEDGISRELGNDLAAIKRPRFSHNDDFSGKHFGQEFDYITANGLLMHMASWQIRKCFDQVSDVLAPNGLLVGTFIEGDENSSAENWTYPEIQLYQASWIESIAAEGGLQLNFFDAPHTLDHRWFVAKRMGSSIPLPNKLDLNVFSWSEYLGEQLVRRGGTPRSLEDYLRHDLNRRLTVENSPGLVPQAITRELS